MATITPQGAVPTSLAALNSEIISIATTLSPGLTADLPGSLIEDLSSTATGGAAVQDAAYVDLVNSISPYNANDFILTELGNVYGVQQGIGSNTSVNVIFTGTVGFVINPGFVVSDGTYQYTVQDGGIINSGGSSAPLYCLAILSGSWAVPADTVTQIITSIPSTITLTCNNTTAGTAGASAQSIDSYRAQVIQAGQAVAQGMATFLKTQLQNVSGVQANLISMRQLDGGWQILVGGGDPYQVAYAIYTGLFNINDLQGESSGGTTTTVAIYDYPDIYSITYVQPVLQNVSITVTWNVIASSNIVSNAVVSSLAGPALVTYINNIFVGQPISLLELQDTFETATASILPLASISELLFVVSIDSEIVNPPLNGVLISGNAEGYFYTTIADIVINQA